MPAHRVAVLALEGVVTFDLTAITQILGACPGGDPPRYEVTVCGTAAGTVASSDGMGLVVAHGLEALDGAGTVVVPGTVSAPDEPPPAVALDALAAAAAAGSRVLSVCVGAFALGHAGLLDGRRATTHWAATATLAARFPAARVETDVLYVDDGDVLTSAGLAGGIDLALHVLRRDHGAAAAADVARWTVVAPQRDGAQAQFVSTSVADADTTTLAGTCAWALEHLDRPVGPADLAAHARASPRTLLRRFRAELGTSPTRWLLLARLDRARVLLETTGLPVETIAARAGFPGAAALRHRFAAVLHTTPTAYRRAYGRSPAPGTTRPDS